MFDQPKMSYKWLLPLLCASSWEAELTVTLQTGQWRWALLFLGSLSSSVRASPFVLDVSAWLPDSVVGPAASAASGTSGALVSEAVSESCEEGEIWGGERVTNSTEETSDTGVSITELLGLSSSFASRLAGSRSDWRPAYKGRNKGSSNCGSFKPAKISLFACGNKLWTQHWHIITF